MCQIRRVFFYKYILLYVYTSKSVRNIFFRQIWIPTNSNNRGKVINSNFIELYNRSQRDHLNDTRMLLRLAALNFAFL